MKQEAQQAGGCQPGKEARPQSTHRPEVFENKAPEADTARPDKVARPQSVNQPEVFEKKVLEHCVRQGLFAPQNRVIAAVSGGADSMALLVFLLRQAAALGITVEAAHVDHGIRGAASAADAAFVARFCAAHGVLLHRFSALEAGITVPEHPSEDWARRLRYGFFEQLLESSGRAPGEEEAAAQGEGDRGEALERVWGEGPLVAMRTALLKARLTARFSFRSAIAPLPHEIFASQIFRGDPERGGSPPLLTLERALPTADRPDGAAAGPPAVRIATAHTLNDQAETLLFRLARGCGLHGAGGIRPARDGFVRPLLAVTRAEVEGYCAALSIPYVQDETNFQPLYARSRLRAGALPALCSVNGEALRHIAGFCEQMQQLDGYFAAKGEILLQTAALRHSEAFAGPWSLDLLAAALETDEPVLEAALIILMRQNLPGFSPEGRIVRLAKGLVARGSGALQLTADVALTAGRGALRLRAAHNVSGRA